MSATASPRWTGNCYQCHRERDVETRPTHAMQVLCDDCASRPHRPPRGWIDLPAEPNGLSASGSAEPEPEIAFVTFAELNNQTPDEPPWVWSGYLAAGAITMLAGKPKSGKSTLACALIEAIDAKTPTFLGREVRGGPVVYVSEESSVTLKPKLPASQRSAVLTRTWPKPSWPALVQAATDKASEIDAALICIDALSFWAGFGPDAEKDAGAAQAIMSALTAATQKGFAVLLVHHQRKSGGEDGDAVRGSGAIFASVDQLLELERCDEDAAANQRQLVSVGRWEPPPVLLIDRRPDTHAWRVIGEAESRQDGRARSLRDRVLRAIPQDEGITMTELSEVIEANRNDWHRELKTLIGEGLVERTGKGVAGNPYLHTKSISKVSTDTDTAIRNQSVFPSKGYGLTDSVSQNLKTDPGDDELVERAEHVLAR
jgi:hypothetical protein